MTAPVERAASDGAGPSSKKRTSRGWRMPARRSARSRWSWPGRRTSSARARGSMTSPGDGRRLRLGGEDGEHRGQVLEPVGDDVDDAALALHLAGDGDEAGAEHDGAERLEHLRPDDDVGDVGLVLDGHEDDAARRARPLADDDEAGDGDAACRSACRGASRSRRCGARRARRRRKETGCAFSDRLR